MGVESIPDFHAYFFIFYNKAYPQEFCFSILIILLIESYLCYADSK